MMRAEQLVIDTMCYTDFPLERALKGIAETGISRVELCASMDSCDHAAPERLGPGGGNRLSRLLREYGLTAASLSAHADITTPPGLIAFTTRLQLASELNITRINMPLPPDREHHRPDVTLRSGLEVDELFCSTLLELADLASSLGVVVCVETVGYMMSDAQQCVDLLSRLNHPNLRINYDPASLLFFVPGSKPTKEDITTLAPYLEHVHLNDKASPEMGQYDFCSLGEGVVEWESMLAEMDRVGYSGPASIEIGWEVTPESPEIVDDAVRRSCRFVERFFSDN
jgi:sugar phosphate isomerase/epimerase